MDARDSRIAIRRVGNVTVVEPEGELNAQRRETLVRTFEGLIRQGFLKIVVDGGRVESVSSAGVGALIWACMKLRKRHGDIRLAGLNARVLEVLRSLNLDQIFGIYHDVEQAIGSYHGEVWM